MSESETTYKADLVTIDNQTAMEAFSTRGGLDQIIDRIAEVVNTTEIDISTAAGRKRCASLARKVASAKVALDKVGAELVSDWKQKVKAVDDERRRMRTELDRLRDIARAPLTEYEEAEKREVAAAQAVIGGLDALGETEGQSLDEMQVSLNKALGTVTDAADKRVDASAAKASVIEKLEKAMQLERERLVVIQEKERALAEAADAREKLEAERRAKQAEIDKAKAVAEAKARAEAEAEKAVRDAEARAKAAEEKARHDAEAMKQAEARQAEERERIIAERAELEAQRKAQQEEQRKAEQEAAERADAEEKARPAVSGQGAVIAKLREAKADLIEVCGLTEEQAKAVVIAISTDKIRNITTGYIVHE